MNLSTGGVEDTCYEWGALLRAHRVTRGKIRPDSNTRRSAANKLRCLLQSYYTCRSKAAKFSFACMKSSNRI
ncbi:hypothetical protein Mapa_013803 [Marchantia paleacea]|nr:hypothetical protein Mapa_013803 [Marchantia paleacea]